MACMQSGDDADVGEPDAGYSCSDHDHGGSQTPSLMGSRPGSFTDASSPPARCPSSMCAASWPPSAMLHAEGVLLAAAGRLGDCRQPGRPNIAQATLRSSTGQDHLQASACL